MYSVEVSALTAVGQAWDYSFFGKGAPDLTLTLSVGGVSIAASKVIKNSYSFPGDIFSGIDICDGDELRLLLADKDLSADDVIAN